MTHGWSPCRLAHAKQRGVVLVAVIVTMSIALTLFGLWARSVVREHQRTATRQYKLQAARLAEAGVRRAAVRHAADPQYQGETWLIAADALDGKHSAEVQIQAVPSSVDATVRYHATAEFPAGATRRAKVTRLLE